MSVTREQLAERLARDVAGRRVWIDPALADLTAAIAASARRVERLVDAEVAVLAAEAVGEGGEIVATEPAFRPAGSRWLAWLELEAGGRIVATVRGPTMARASRIFTELGVLEANPGGGLVIIELAPGVSAVQLQARSEPTLLISPRVDVMATAPEGD